MITTIVFGEREIGQVRQRVYKVGDVVDKLNAHNTPSGHDCKTRRGTVVEVRRNNIRERAFVHCECLSTVIEGA
jgi:hypothetical protein